MNKTKRDSKGRYVKGHKQKHSESTKLKIGLANKGKANVRKGTKGLQHHSQETRDKISEINRKRWADPEQRKILEKINIGRKLTQDHKDKITQFNKNRWQDPKYRKHMLKVIKVPTTLGTKQSQETINKRMNTMKPIFESQEYKAKLREKRLHQVFPQKDSKPEKQMQLFLDVNSIKYEKHKAILGQPDIFIEPNICMFIDGCYWHGCKECHPDIEKYPNIVRQIIRDTEITHKLIADGYLVLRYWEHTINLHNGSDGLLRILRTSNTKLKEVY